MITLTDDGTMDTVLRCSECGEEFRFMFDGEDGRDIAYEQEESGGYWHIIIDGKPVKGSYTSESAAEEAMNERRYDEWVAECMEEVDGDHICHEFDDTDLALGAEGDE
jgi:hypothetical protein